MPRSDYTDDMYCINGCRKPVVAERLNDFIGEDEVVELVCADCLGELTNDE